MKDLHLFYQNKTPCTMYAMQKMFCNLQKVMFKFAFRWTYLHTMGLRFHCRKSVATAQKLPLSPYSPDKFWTTPSPPLPIIIYNNCCLEKLNFHVNMIKIKLIDWYVINYKNILNCAKNVTISLWKLFVNSETSVYN